MTSFLQFATQLDTPTVSLAPDQCVRRLHKEAPCNFCFETCPTGAITKADPVALDLERCVNCGLCLHLCPTEAFTRPDNRAGKLLNVLASLSDNQVELACPSKANMAATRADVGAIVEVKPCLASISPSTLLSAASKKNDQKDPGQSTSVWLNDEPCAECPIGSVQDQIVRVAEMTNRLLDAVGSESRVLTFRSSPQLLGNKVKRRRVEQGNRMRYSRRGFLQSLLNPVEKALEEGRESNASAAAALSNESDRDRGLPRLPESRRALINSLKSLEQTADTEFDATGSTFGSVTVEGECVACGLCARICPTDALVFEEKSGKFGIEFVIAGCLGCSLCELICPTKVVKMKHVVEVEKLLSASVDTLVTGDLAKCQECGMSCAAGQDEPLCFVCRWRKSVPNSDIYSGNPLNTPQAAE